MNVRLQYDCDFLAGIYYEDQLQINSYSISLSLLTASKDAVNSNIAMERLKCFVHGVLENTVFINQANMERAEMLSIMGVNITTLPEEPVDQIVGMMLYYKLNAIMEGRMIVSGLDISSSLGDNIWYLHDEEDSAGPFAKDGWWHKASVQHETLEPDAIPNNVVKVTSTGWYEMGLDWPEERNEPAPTGNTVIYPDFSKHETK
jgi:hypothetical protein